tara:strand:+ start:7366 stop:7602 length:237 start_codon:yes stop_codon:yes gene_type:complete
MLCALCLNEIPADASGWVGGHNPSPVVTDQTARCCEECNATIVIPVRMLLSAGDVGDWLPAIARAAEENLNDPRSPRD